MIHTLTDPIEGIRYVEIGWRKTARIVECGGVWMIAPCLPDGTPVAHADTIEATDAAIHAWLGRDLREPYAAWMARDLCEPPNE